MKKEQLKEYTLQGKKYVFEKPCLKLTEKLDNIYDKYIRFENTFPDFADTKKRYKQLQSRAVEVLSHKELSKIKNDPKKVLDLIKVEPDLYKDIVMVTVAYNEQSLNIKKKYLSKYDNVKELLDTCLAESNIDYEVTGDEYTELKKVAEEVMSDFFLLITN